MTVEELRGAGDSPGRRAVTDATVAVTVERLRRRFGRQEVLRDVSFELPAGRFALLLGDNGAGKTTLLRVVAGLLAPSGGRIMVAGHDVRVHARAVRRQVGFVAHRPLVYSDLTARENLRLYAALYGVEGVSARADELLHRVGLAGRADARAGDLSHGLRQRLAIARALLHRPSVLLLDEPYVGLDERGSLVLDDILDELAGRTTVLLVTHDPDRPSRWANNALLLRDGRIESVAPTAHGRQRARVPAGA